MREYALTEHYKMELYLLAENKLQLYGQLRDKTICNQLVVSILDAGLSQQLQLNPDLMVEKAKK